MLETICRTAGAVVLAAVLVSGCGVEPSGVEDGGPAPTGLAKGTTLYFVDVDGQLQPSMRTTGRLGTVLGALQLLLAGVSGSEVDAGLRSEVPSEGVRVSVVDAGEDVRIQLPFSGADISSDGVDQVICTASAVVAASGRDIDSVEVSVNLVSGEEVSRICPVLR